MPISETRNCDCMEYMRSLPDKYFDLACVDPPYGEGLAESGGCQGWFTKYHQEINSQSVNVERERERESKVTHWNRFGQRFDRYKQDEQDMDKGRIASSLTERGVMQVGEMSAQKKVKKSFRGTLRRDRIILRSCSVSHAIRSFGVETIFLYHRQDAF